MCARATTKFISYTIKIVFISVINTFVIERRKMNINRRIILLLVSALTLSAPALKAQPGRAWNDKDDPTKRDTVRSYAQYFSVATKAKKTPDDEGSFNVVAS